MSSIYIHSTFVALAVAVWFAILFTLLRPTRPAPLADRPYMAAALLLAVYLYLPYAFLVQRGGGTELLEQGLSSSNVLTIAIVAVAAAYCAVCVAGDRRLTALLADRVLFPFWMFIAIALASAAWSIVPGYTVYRAGELAVMFSLCLLIFDRTDFEQPFVRAHVVLLIGWIGVHALEMVESLARGTVFSSAKDNMLPLLCVSLVLLLAITRRRPQLTVVLVLLAAGCFVAAGSAATVGALPLVLAGLLAASSSRRMRVLGIAASVVWMLLFTVLLAGLGSFPDLMQTVSVLLQKPVEELERATGRGQFWPLFLDATAGRNFGSGFAAGERFIQLLLDPVAVQERMGRANVFIASAHNMVIGAWVATGWLGLLTMLACLGMAWREGMRLDLYGRRYVLPMLLLLFANGLTTPGLFGEFNMHTIAWVGLLCFVRSRAAATGQRHVAAPARRTTRALDVAPPRRRARAPTELA